MTQKKAPRMPELQTLELEAEKQYLAKLRNQREKVGRLPLRSNSSIRTTIKPSSGSDSNNSSSTCRKVTRA